MFGGCVREVTHARARVRARYPYPIRTSFRARSVYEGRARSRARAWVTKRTLPCLLLTSVTVTDPPAPLASPVLSTATETSAVQQCAHLAYGFVAVWNG
jgi:hypothetical protein